MSPAPKHKFSPGFSPLETSNGHQKHKFLTGFIFFYVILIIFIDQLAKFFICRIFTPLQSLPVIKSVFHITLVFNKGGAFGIFANATSIFIFISVVAVVAMLVFMLKAASAYDTKAILACITGGAVSNLIDRLRFGYVVDFLDLRIWPVFNIADSAITIGTAWLVWKMIVKKPSK